MSEKPPGEMGERETSRPKRKWDVNERDEFEGDEFEKEETKLLKGCSEQNEEVKGPSSKKLIDALKKAREHAAQISSTISTLQQAPKIIDIPNNPPPKSSSEDTNISKAKPFQVPEQAEASKRKLNFGRDEFSTIIEINDVKNRYVITKGTTQIKIRQETGADVITRGKFYPDKNMATEKDPPLHLRVSAQTKDALDKAVEMINEMINQSATPLENTKRISPTQSDRDRYPFSEKIVIEIDPDRMFNLRAKILGPGGTYVKHIQQETGAKVQLRGKGSGYLEPNVNKEAQVALFISIGGSTQSSVDSARVLCNDLISNVKNEYNRFTQHRITRLQTPILQPNFINSHTQLPCFPTPQQGTYPAYNQHYPQLPLHMVPNSIQSSSPYPMPSNHPDSIAMDPLFNTQYPRFTYSPIPHDSTLSSPHVFIPPPPPPPSPPPPPPSPPPPPPDSPTDTSFP